METRFDQVFFIPGENSAQYPYCNSLYIDGDVKVLVDPASDRDRLVQIRDSSGVDAVLLSHWHEDHFMHLDLFDNKELWMSQEDAAPLQSLEHLFDAYGMNQEERESWTGTMLHMFHFKPRFSDRRINNGEVLELGGNQVEVIHTPGHTPGHVALYFRESEVLFLGDYDFTAFGPWYGDVHSDIDATIASVNKLRAIPARVWLSSHGAGVFESDPGSLWDGYLAVIEDRDQRLLEVLKEPRTMSDIVEARIVYRKKKEPKEFSDFGERAIMSKHLQRLIKQGSVTFDDHAYHRT